MTLPKFTEGTLYIDRDRDVRTGEWGPYVKIGIVREGKTPEQRVSELQTGNPRRVHTIKTYLSPMVENLETRLHHHFAEYWVRGEWFDMDNDFVDNELNETIQEYITEQEENIENHKQRVEMGSTASNGTIRDPEDKEVDLHTEYIAVKSRNDVANAQAQILKRKMMEEMGDSGGIEGILKLSKSVTPEKITEAAQKFDKKKFKEEYRDLYDQYVVISNTVPKGTLVMKKVPALKDLNSDLRDLEKASADTCGELKLRLCDEEVDDDRTDSLKELHFDYISLLGEIFDTDLEMERIKSKLAVELGEFEGIKDIITWKRESKIKEKLDPRQIQQEEIDAYTDCLEDTPQKTTAEKVVVSILVEMYREYEL
jgi:hypothetical protein